MAELVPAFVGALVWLVVYRRRRELKYTSVAFVMFPMAIVFAIKAQWWHVLAAVVPGAMGIIADLVRIRRREARIKR